MAERRVCVVARHLCSAPTSVTETTAASTLPPVVGGDPRVFATMSNCEDRTGGCDLQKLLPGPLDDERIRKVSLISVVFQVRVYRFTVCQTPNDRSLVRSSKKYKFLWNGKQYVLLAGICSIG